MGESQLVNVYDCIIKWAKSLPLPKDIKSKVDLDSLGEKDVNLDHLSFHHSTAKHKLNEDPSAGIPTPKTYVIFSSVFTNDTQKDQQYSLRTERKTISTSQVNVTKGLVVGQNMSLKLSPPIPVLSANAGFKLDWSFKNSTQSTSTEELVWTLDSQVNVPPQTRTRANLVIEEQNYEGTFRVDTIIEGKLSVKLKDKSGAIVTAPQAPDIRQVFLQTDGFEHVGLSKVKFVTMGHCRCRFGIQQRVDLQETKLRKEEVEAEEEDS